MQGKQDNKKRSWIKCIGAVFLYVGLLCWATVLSLNYYAHHQPKTASETKAYALFVVPFEEALTTETWECAGKALKSLLTSEKSNKCTTVPGGVASLLHEEQSLREGFSKIWVVLLISLLWFVTFVTANAIKVAYKDHLRSATERPSDHGKRLAIISGLAKWTLAVVSILLPVTPFVISMHLTYEPAVLVMALVAIFVAAEHYIGLREAEHALQEKSDGLMDVMETVLNADALATWRAQLYGQYADATQRIDAVIRYFDIDSKWWKCAELPDPWEAYFKSCKPNDETLFTALKNSRADVQFVADLELPFVGQPPDARFFRNLLGLAWQLDMFEEVQRLRRQAEINRRLGIRITHAAFWMHVVDDVVYQVIERGETETATVRELTRNSSNWEALAEWSRLNITQIAERGGPAEEYVFSALRYAALKVCGDEDELNEIRLGKILRCLGMKEYLEKPNEEFLLSGTAAPDNAINKSVNLSSDAAEAMCISAFEKLIESRLTPGCANPKRKQDETLLQMEDLLCAIV